MIRVNSQSGKGGIAYLLESEHGVELPRRLQIDFSHQVQRHADTTGHEVAADELWRIFQETYLTSVASGVEMIGVETSETSGSSRTLIDLRIDEAHHSSAHEDMGPVEALAVALRSQGIEIEVLDLHQSGVGAGNHGEALTLIEYRHSAGTAWAAGKDRSALTANLHAVVAAANAIRAGGSVCAGAGQVSA